HDVARIDKSLRRGGRVDGGLLEEARGMSGGGHLLDALSEGVAAADEIGDLTLIAVDFNRTRPEEIGSGGEVEEVSFHCVSFFEFSSEECEARRGIATNGRNPGRRGPSLRSGCKKKRYSIITDRAICDLTAMRWSKLRHARA